MLLIIPCHCFVGPTEFSPSRRTNWKLPVLEKKLNVMIERSQLWSLEEYSDKRADFRRQVLAHKKNRRVMLGDHIQLIFEDELTIRYQIQEMLRIEKVFESAGIQEELDAYNPLLPDGNNWKCSMLIQYAEVEERKRRLADLRGVEDKIWVKVADGERTYAIADEDLDRSNDVKTSAVHFLRFQLTADQVASAIAGKPIVLGIDHLAYPLDDVLLGEDTRKSLVADLKSAR